MVENVLHLKPAYGRSYENQEMLMKDWEEGKDFKIIDGPYLSIRNLDHIRELGFRALIISSCTFVKQGTFTKIIFIQE
jgi:hypothetical protein